MLIESWLDELARSGLSYGAQLAAIRLHLRSYSVTELATHMNIETRQSRRFIAQVRKAQQHPTDVPKVTAPDVPKVTADSEDSRCTKSDLLCSYAANSQQEVKRYQKRPQTPQAADVPKVTASDVPKVTASIKTPVLKKSTKLQNSAAASQANAPRKTPALRKSGPVGRELTSNEAARLMAYLLDHKSTVEDVPWSAYLDYPPVRTTTPQNVIDIGTTDSSSSSRNPEHISGTSSSTQKYDRNCIPECASTPELVNVGIDRKTPEGSLERCTYIYSDTNTISENILDSNITKLKINNIKTNSYRAIPGSTETESETFDSSDDLKCNTSDNSEDEMFPAKESRNLVELDNGDLVEIDLSEHYQEFEEQERAERLKAQKPESKQVSSVPLDPEWQKIIEAVIKTPFVHRDLATFEREEAEREAKQQFDPECQCIVPPPTPARWGRPRKINPDARAEVLRETAKIREEGRKHREECAKFERELEAGFIN